MKKMLLLLTICAGSVLTLGCGGGPTTSTKEDADKSMEETMNLDVSAEADADAAGGDAGAGDAGAGDAGAGDAGTGDAATAP